MLNDEKIVQKIYNKVYDSLVYCCPAQNLRQWNETDFRWLVLLIVQKTVEELQKEKT